MVKFVHFGKAPRAPAKADERTELDKRIDEFFDMIDDKIEELRESGDISGLFKIDMPDLTEEELPIFIERMNKRLSDKGNQTFDQ